VSDDVGGRLNGEVVEWYGDAVDELCDRQTDRQTDRHGTTVSTALALRSDLKRHRTFETGTKTSILSSLLAKTRF